MHSQAVAIPTLGANPSTQVLALAPISKTASETFTT